MLFVNGLFTHFKRKRPLRQLPDLKCNKTIMLIKYLMKRFDEHPIFFRRADRDAQATG